MPASPPALPRRYHRASSITGADVRELRRALDLSQSELAELLGTTVATVYRWEAMVDLPPAMSSHPKRVFLCLQSFRAESDDTTWNDFVVEIQSALRVSGGLYALYVVLNRALPLADLVRGG